MSQAEQILDDVYFETAKRSFKFFMNVIIGWKNPPFLDELDDIISDPIYNKIVAAYPRGHGKSNHLSIGYPLWRMALNHNVTMLITSKSASTASGFLRGVINHIDNNSKYQAFSRYCDPLHIGVVPKMVRQTKMEEKWSGMAITIDRDNITIKDPTIQVIGLFGSIISRRADEIIADDVVDQKNSETEEQREKIKDWVDTTLIPVLVPGGRFIYLGNTWHMSDLVAKLLEDPRFDFRSRLKSIIHEPNDLEIWNKWASIRLDTNVDPKTRLENADKFYEENKEKMEEGAVVLWPERFPYKDLYLLRMANSYAFARMYQCDPSLRPDQKFQEDWINKARIKGKDLKMQDAPREGLTMDLTVSGMDLAISLKDNADDTVLLTLDRVKYGNGIINPGDFIVRNIRRGKMTPSQVRDMIKNHNDNVKPLGIRVESVAYQESMVRDLLELGHANVRGYKTGGEKNDMTIGVNSLSILMENGKFIIPYCMEDPRTIQLSNMLINEMRSWPDGHTGDSLMALWFAYLEARDLTGKRFVIPSGNPQIPETVEKTDAAIEAWKADMELIAESTEDRKRGIGATRKKGFII
jgi:hypothetical protein